MTKVSQRQLQWWDEHKVISPKKDGHGRRYTAEEVMGIRLIVALRRKGLSLQGIRRMWPAAYKKLQHCLSPVWNGKHDVYLLTDGQTAKVAYAADIAGIIASAQKPMYCWPITAEVRRLLKPTAQAA